MSKFLSASQITEYRENGYLAPVDIMAEDEDKVSHGGISRTEDAADRSSADVTFMDETSRITN